MAGLVSGRILEKETLGARLRRLARAARHTNQYVNGTMSSPPTITQSATQPAGQTNGQLAVAASSPLRTSGGVPVAFFSTGYRFPVATLSSSGTGGNVSGALTANSWQAEVMADAQKVTFYVPPSTTPYRFLVQSAATGGKLQYVDTTGTLTTTSGGSNYYFTLDFGSRALRKVVIEGEQAHAIWGFYVGATESAFLTDGADVVRGLWLTDSFGDMVAGGRQNDSFASVMGAALGIRDRRVSAVGSAGWLNNVSGTRYTVGQRIAVDAVPQMPDVGFIVAGINDAGLSSAGIATEVMARIREWRAALPSVPLFVFGAWPGSTGPSASILAVENAISAGVTAANDSLTFFIPISTDTNGAWFSGTGRIGATTGAGNTDLYLNNADATHWNTAGHLYGGLRAADAVMGRLNALR